ncbi:MAG TPA: hypothetical protein VF450_24260 [Noviherbaspirillum sp.]
MENTTSILGNLSAIYLGALIGASCIAQIVDSNAPNVSMNRVASSVHLIGGSLSALVLASPTPEVWRVLAGGFVAFVALIGGVNDLRKKEPCHCLGGLIPDYPLVMNALRLGALAAATMLAVSYTNRTTSWSIAALIISGAAWIGFFLRLKYLQYSRLFYAQRYRRHAAPSSVESSWAVGMESEQPIQFGELLAERITLLVGISSTCKSCHQVADELGKLLAVASSALQVVVVSNSERMREQLPKSGIRYLVDSEIEVAKHLGVGGTPFLVLIGPDGGIKFAPVDGRDSVLAKLKEVFGGFSSP